MISKPALTIAAHAAIARLGNLPITPSTTGRSEWNWCLTPFPRTAPSEKPLALAALTLGDDLHRPESAAHLATAQRSSLPD